MNFFDQDGDVRMTGGSKPNFLPDPADRSSAEQEGIPDGTISDVLDVLAVLSKSHGVDWEITHEAYDGPIGNHS